MRAAESQGADVVENFLPKQSCLRFLKASKRHLNALKLLLTFTKNFEGPLAFMYGYLNFNMSSQSRNSIFLTRLFQEKFSTTSDPRFLFVMAQISFLALMLISNPALLILMGHSRIPRCSFNVDLYLEALSTLSTF